MHWKNSKPLCQIVQVIVQVWRWKQQYMAQLDADPLPEMQQLIQWLETHVPAADSDPSQTRISHGDYRYISCTADLLSVAYP